MKYVLESALRLLAILACLQTLAASSQAEMSLKVYDFNLGPNSSRNVDYAKSLGFDGIVTGLSTQADLSKLQDYTQCVLSLDDFDLFAFVYYDFNNPRSPGLWRSALPILALTDAPLWVIVKNAPSPTATVDLLENMARWTQYYGIQTVIYPHWNTSIETAEDAAALMALVAHPNLKSSLQTCHEIRGGNQYDLPAVVAAHASESALVTIAGADNRAYYGPPPAGGQPWSDAIKPLDEGDYSLLPFLQALKDAGYDGPVILHTFGITNNPGHLQRSILKYEQYCDDLQ